MKGGIINHSLSGALEIANKNKKAYSIYPHVERGYINIVRNTNDWDRVATYSANTGKLVGMSRRPLGDNGIIDYNGKGLYRIQDFVNNGKDWFNKSFDNLKDVVKYFKQELPVVARLNK